jgi:hypothetical protein
VKYPSSSLSSSSDLDSTIYRRRLEQIKGVPICIYTAPHFRELYQQLASRDLIWSNPRFAHLDSCDTTLDEALASRTLRFKDIVDLDTGALFLERRRMKQLVPLLANPPALYYGVCFLLKGVVLLQMATAG